MFDLALLKAWILSVMLGLAPNTPWKDTYDATAEAMAEAANEHPLYSFKTDEQRLVAVRRTAATYLSVAWFEGSFNPRAAGDCPEKKKDGTCVAGSTPSSFGMFQINASNLKYLEVTKEELLEDVKKSVESAHKMMAISFSVCRAQPLERLLDHYTVGGDGCTSGSDKGKHRMLKAKWIYDHFALKTE